MTYRQMIMTSGTPPIGYWRMETTAGYDEITAANATVVGTQTVVTGATVGENGLSFIDAYMTYIDLGAGYANYTLDRSWSIEIWVKIPATRTGGTAYNRANGAGPQYPAHVSLSAVGADNYNPNMVGIGISDGTTNRSVSAYRPAVGDGAWHHLAATQSVTGGLLKLYFDGTPAGSVATYGVTPDISSSYTHRIGHSGQNNASYGNFYGHLDEFAIYDYALTDAQILAHATFDPITYAGTARGTTASLTAAVARGKMLDAAPIFTANRTAAVRLRQATAATRTITASLTAEALHTGNTLKVTASLTADVSQVHIPATYGSVIAADAPIGWWRMESTANAYNEITQVNDTLAVTQPLSIPGAVGGNGWRTGSIGVNETYHSNAYIDLGNGYPEYMTDGTWSIECWFQRTDDDLPGSDIMYFWTSAAKRVSISMVGRSVNVVVLGFGANLGYKIYDNGAWHHIVVAGSNTSSKVYIDAVDMYTFSSSAVATFGSTGIEHRIGAGTSVNYPDDQVWRGGIDEFAIYNYALTPAQITAHYNASMHSTGTVVTASRTTKATTGRVCYTPVSATLTASAAYSGIDYTADTSLAVTAAVSAQALRFFEVALIDDGLGNTAGVRLQAPGGRAGTNHYEIFRSVTDRFWKHAYANTTVVSGVTYQRILRQPNGANTTIDVTDQSVESGVAYTYFIRAIGSDLVSYTDSLLFTTTCTLEHTWLVPVTQAVGTVAPVNCEFRFANPGLGEASDLESTTLLFAGRSWPVIDYGVHESSVFAVKLDLPYGEFAAGYGDEAVLKSYAVNGTMLVYRDRRGRKAYGRIDGLSFTDTQYGKTAAFSFQSLDIDSSV